VITTLGWWYLLGLNGEEGRRSLGRASCEAMGFVSWDYYAAEASQNAESRLRGSVVDSLVVSWAGELLNSGGRTGL